MKPDKIRKHGTLRYRLESRMNFETGPLGLIRIRSRFHCPLHLRVLPSSCLFGVRRHPMLRLIHSIKDNHGSTFAIAEHSSLCCTHHPCRACSRPDGHYPSPNADMNASWILSVRWSMCQYTKCRKSCWWLRWSCRRSCQNWMKLYECNFIVVHLCLHPVAS